VFSVQSQKCGLRLAQLASIRLEAGGETNRGSLICGIKGSFFLISSPSDRRLFCREKPPVEGSETGRAPRCKRNGSGDPLLHFGADGADGAMADGGRSERQSSEVNLRKDSDPSFSFFSLQDPSLSELFNFFVIRAKFPIRCKALFASTMAQFQFFLDCGKTCSSESSLHTGRCPVSQLGSSARSKRYFKRLFRPWPY